MSRGQSMVEFALVFPMLVVLLLGIADFGRVFAAAITEEAAARDAAEAGAQEWQQLCQKYSPPCSTGLTSGDYDTLHALALDVACHEAENMPGEQFAPGDPLYPYLNCDHRILVAVCIHDDGAGDTTCGTEAPPVGGPCYGMDSPWSAARDGPAGGRPYVEVRMCSRFDPLIDVALAGFGSVWLQKSNDFAVSNY